MAWTHYIAPLAQSDLAIRHAQAREVTEALRERSAAVGLPISSIAEWDRAVFDRTIRNPLFGTGQGGRRVPISYLISRLAYHYMRDENGAQGTWNDSNLTTTGAAALWQTAAADVGVPLARRTAMQLMEVDPPNRYTVDYWNVCRRAIQLLRWPIYRNPFTIYTKTLSADAWTDYANWETNIDDWIALTESSSPGGVRVGMFFNSTSGDAGLRGYRLTFSLTLPAAPYSNGPYDIWTRVSERRNRLNHPTDPFPARYGPKSMTLTLGSTTVQTDGIPDGIETTAVKFTLGSSLTATGTLAGEISIDDYFGSSISAFEPVWQIPWPPAGGAFNPTTYLEIVFSLLNSQAWLATTPTFTHPWEA